MINQNEMIKLAVALTNHNIPFTTRSFFNGLQIAGDGWDAICHDGSYGHEQGLIEVMGFDDDVIGNLTAEQVIKMVLEN